MKFSEFTQITGLAVDPEAQRKLEQLEQLYFRFNKQHNLFSKSDTPRFRERHLLDSLIPLLATQAAGIQPRRIIDIGSGTGLPLLPLACMLPDCQLIGTDPRAKRIAQITHLAREVGLKNVEAYAVRTEELSAELLTPGADLVTARAVGTLEEDWERARPLLRVGGLFATFKTRESDTLLEGAQVRCHAYRLDPDLQSIPYTLITVEKQV